MHPFDSATSRVPWVMLAALAATLFVNPLSAQYVTTQELLTRQAGDLVEIEIPSKASHFEVVAPWSPRWPEIRDSIRGTDDHVRGGRDVHRGARHFRTLAGHDDGDVLVVDEPTVMCESPHHIGSRLAEGHPHDPPVLQRDRWGFPAG